jgi:hypothetical protein
MLATLKGPILFIAYVETAYRCHGQTDKNAGWCEQALGRELAHQARTHLFLKVDALE